MRLGQLFNIRCQQIHDDDCKNDALRVTPEMPDQEGEDTAAQPENTFAGAQIAAAPADWSVIHEHF